MVFVRNKYTEQELSHTSFESIENSKKGIEGQPWVIDDKVKGGMARVKHR